MKTLLIALGAVTALAAQAGAADLPVRTYTKAPATAVAAAYDWTGFYIGIDAGYGWARDVHADLLLPSGGYWTPGPNGPFGGAQDIKPAGAVYGGQAGYNWQLGSWVLGIEGQFNGADLRQSKLSIFAPAAFRLSAKADAYGAVSGRLGYAFNNLMPYIKGGYAVARLNTHDFDINGVYFDNTSWHDGYVVGAGLEYAFVGNWIVGVEYDYMDLGTKFFSKENVGINAGRPEFYNDKFRISTVTGRLSYKFGGPVIAKY